MELLVNDLSIHGQFPDLPAFRESIGRVMVMRDIARRFGHHLHCHRNVVNALVTRDVRMQQAMQVFDRDERQAVMQWFTRYGPFWDDERSHTPDDYLYMESNGEVVTNTAVGEAAYSCFKGAERNLVSLKPSSWNYSPFCVNWFDSGEVYNVEVTNHWEADELERTLQNAPTAILSWVQLAEVCQTRCPQLRFSADTFDPLHGHPFFRSAAERIKILLDTLNAFKQCFDEDGHRTREGQQLYQDHFTGDKAWFSPSADSEMHRFEKELTFRHPDIEGQSMFCPYHGKVKTPQLRIHFSWPVSAIEPLYVVYIGPKITKR